ncbi:hypothetical protein SSP531S_06080 [Streptomyces spongiicola]|uniref:Uncharacterized protein n=1 Tax=Streptomyces spongiicola TaxID=1690221 RepID=A0A2S1Z058_9ACTN|nr:hypothetical protein [Streptomyces spongiicola]AWK09298.1 hypothetical protein DDQ41_10600 [Streptomyces spongiicola]GBP99213.1 hypothetical protein SSP531S_06080 [Streptomyces spongiicola]
MTSARHLATIELLRSRPFPVRPGRSAVGSSAPGYHTAELSTSEEFWDDPSHLEAVGEQFAAEREALAAVLSTRWGPPQVFSLGSMLAASVAGERIPEPWALLSASVPDVHLWRAGGRWLVLGVSKWAAELPYQLLAVVTEVDPP